MDTGRRMSAHYSCPSSSLLPQGTSFPILNRRHQATPTLVFRSLRTLSLYFALSLPPMYIPITSFVPSSRMPMAMYTAFFTTWSFTWQRIASRNMTMYLLSSGLVCQTFASGSTRSVILLIISAEASMPYMSQRCDEMSLVVMPFTYIEMHLFSISVLTIYGSNVLFLSRSTSSSISPNDVVTVVSCCCGHCGCLIRFHRYARISHIRNNHQALLRACLAALARTSP